MITGVILFIGMSFGMGITPFVLGVTKDHFSFQAGIFCLGVGLPEEEKVSDRRMLTLQRVRI